MPAPHLPESLHQAAKRIRLLVLDCDGVLTNGDITLGANGFEAKSFCTKDGMGMALWRKAGRNLACITGRSSQALQRRAEELQLEHLFQGITDKRAVLADLQTRLGIDPAETAYIGDDINDLRALPLVGLFFCPQDANDLVRPHATHILATPGGRGAVREAIDLLLTAQGELENIVRAYLA